MTFVAIYGGLGGLVGAVVLWEALWDGLQKRFAIPVALIAAFCWPMVALTAGVARLAR